MRTGLVSDDPVQALRVYNKFDTDDPNNVVTMKIF